MSPRKRIKGPEWLPVRCYVGKSAYEYRPKSGGCVRLGKLTESKEVVLAKYNAARLLHEEPTGAFSELIRQYLASVNYKSLSCYTCYIISHKCTFFAFITFIL